LARPLAALAVLLARLVVDFFAPLARARVVAALPALVAALPALVAALPALLAALAADFAADRVLPAALVAERFACVAVDFADFAWRVAAPFFAAADRLAFV